LFQARQDDEHSPLRVRSAQLRQQLQEKNSYLQSLHDRLVEPDRMVGLLEQVLNKNGKLQLVSLKTLPVSPVMPQGTNAAEPGAKADNEQKQIFKHGVQITVRGSYLDLLQYLAALEKVPVQLFWGDVSFSVDQYPDAVLTLTLYTLSLDKTWLAI
jgi:MSHA biogenesis protein MshJ